MKKLLILILPLLMAADWPEGVEGGLEIARQHCLRSDNLREILVFEFEEDGKTVVFPVSCLDVLEYLRVRDQADVKT